MKKIIYTASFVLLLALAGCSDWLNVQPLGQTEEEQMFKEESGFLRTLTGTYKLLGDKNAYGQQLTIGFPEYVAHNWLPSGPFYEFKYDDAAAENQLYNTWMQLYKAIANTNLVLKNLEGRSPSEFDNYDLIKGEALGLRAYIHLDLLRLFGPVLKGGGVNSKSIPYHEKFSNQTVPLMTAQEVLGKIKTDLEEAYGLLQNDPVKTWGRRTVATSVGGQSNNEDLAFDFRGTRMNYYAVCGALARCHMLLEEPANALKYAMEVIEAKNPTKAEEGLFRFVDLIDITGGDQIFEPELVWSLYDPNTREKLSEFLLWNPDYTGDSRDREWVYDTREVSYGGVADYRNVYWWTWTSTTPSRLYISKYQRKMAYSSSGATDETKWEKVVPMIRLSEMYLIAAEANLGTNNPEAFRLLNEVRVARNILALEDTYENDRDGLMRFIVYENQKETWGEGKLFFLYKRLFHDIVTVDGTTPANNRIFELPVPKDEMELGGN